MFNYTWSVSNKIRRSNNGLRAAVGKVNDSMLTKYIFNQQNAILSGDGLDFACDSYRS